VCVRERDSESESESESESGSERESESESESLWQVRRGDVLTVPEGARDDAVLLEALRLAQLLCKVRPPYKAVATIF